MDGSGARLARRQLDVARNTATATWWQAVGTVLTALLAVVAIAADWKVHDIEQSTAQLEKSLADARSDEPEWATASDGSRYLIYDGLIFQRAQPSAPLPTPITANDASVSRPRQQDLWATVASVMVEHGAVLGSLTLTGLLVRGLVRRRVRTTEPTTEQARPAV